MSQAVEGGKLRKSDIIAYKPDRISTHVEIIPAEKL